MMRIFAIGLAWLVLPLQVTAVAAAVTSDALDAGIAEETRLAGPLKSSAQPETVVRVVAPPPAPERPLSANPLWAVPLARLSGTRDRPIFSPSRRPPPPAVAEAAPATPPPSPRKQEAAPPLNLVGTIAGDEASFGIFLDQSTKAALRLKLGEDYQGWRLRAIQGRQVTMEKDQQSAVLTLPLPGSQSSGEVRLIPVSALSAANAVEETRAARRR